MEEGWDAERWQHSQDLLAMLRFPWPWLTSDRKFWLFAMACLREVWHDVQPTAREAVERLEHFIEAAEVEQAQDDLNAIIEALTPPDWGVEAESAAWDARRARREVAALLSHYVLSPSEQSILFEVYCGQLGAARRAGPDVEAAWQEQEAIVAELLRDVVGNPFLPPPTLAPQWLAWNDAIAGRIALAVHDERDFGRLPILADALEEAGCEDAVVLSHCRDGGRHARGCWVVDLVLGRHVLVEREGWRGR